MPSPEPDDLVEPPFPLSGRNISLTAAPKLTTLDNRVQHTTKVTGNLWSFDVNATLSSPKGVGAAGAHCGTGEQPPSAAQSNPCHIDPIVVTDAGSLFSPQVILRTNVQRKRGSPNPDVIATSGKAPRKALLSLRKCNDTTLEMTESFSQRKDQPIPLNSSYQIPVPAAVTERKRAPGVSSIGQGLAPHSSPNDCEEILKVLEKIQTRVAEGLYRKFQGARHEVRIARDLVFQQARADLDYIRQQSINGEGSLGDVVNDLTVQRRDLEQRSFVSMTTT
ncbi:hypothetical protein M407DRAFT_209006 [Tulasnella calospora MUT 4182]|uniref:Uncharacterized protein n=1 Tax=Tulasnella calospora MUT 4182 TaxID=1051891 RepID=A0A0C3LW20_9AGAM|nr:hypothetical protein M407DRAFT_209006 [Tulasnella calospora MUT 4182]